MNMMECTASEEPLCLADRKHDWGREINNADFIGDGIMFQGKHWQCVHCKWIRTLRYPGVTSYSKRIPITHRIEWPDDDQVLQPLDTRKATDEQAREWLAEATDAQMNLLKFAILAVRDANKIILAVSAETESIPKDIQTLTTMLDIDTEAVERFMRIWKRNFSAWKERDDRIWEERKTKT